MEIHIDDGDDNNDDESNSVWPSGVGQQYPEMSSFVPTAITEPFLS